MSKPRGGKRFRKELTAERLATFKSRVNEMRLLVRLLSNGDLSSGVAARELQRVQNDLHTLSSTQ